MSEDLAAVLKKLSAAKPVLRAFTNDPAYKSIVQSYLKMIEDLESRDELTEGRLDLVDDDLKQALVTLHDSATSACESAAQHAIHVNFEQHSPGLWETGHRYELPDIDKHPVVGTTDGGGWLVKVDLCNGKTFTDRVIAWAIQGNGTITPVCLEDTDGAHYYPTLEKAFTSVTVYHPDNPRQDDPGLVPE